MSSYKVPVLFSDFNETLIFRDTFSKRNIRYKVSSKFVQWQPAFFMRTDRLSDMKKLIISFRNFTNASKNVQLQMQGSSTSAFA